MRSPRSVLRALLLALALVAALPAAAAVPAQEVRKAAAEVQRDPLLGGEHKEKTLRFRPDDERPPVRDSDMPPWLRWMRDLARWFAEAGRLLVWLLAAVAVALLIVGARRWMRVRGESKLPGHGTVPSHVQGLDIRAASLPDAVGAAAAQLWQAGEHRAALSLLYRGALSRLVHRHRVPVRGSSTEAECVTLARGHVDRERSEFFARLVEVWQLAVYGARLPEAEVILAVCHDFDQLWPHESVEAAA